MVAIELEKLDRATSLLEIVGKRAAGSDRDIPILPAVRYERRYAAHIAHFGLILFDAHA